MPTTLPRTSLELSLNTRETAERPKLRKSYFGSLFFDSETDLTLGEGCCGGISDGAANRFAIDREVKGGTLGINDERIAFARTTGKRRSGTKSKVFPVTISIVAQE